MSKAERVQRLQERLTTEAIPWLEQRTVAIYAVSETGVPVPHGSGVLLQVADKGFLLTAGHCLEPWGELALVVGVGGDEGIEITQLRAEVTRDQDNADFALLPLPEAVRDRVAASKKFTQLSETDVDPNLAQGIYAVLGYPVELAKPDGQGGVTSHAFFYPTQIDAAADVIPGFTMALEIDVENVDADGDRARLPSLRGISGCGLWRLHASEDSATDWSIDQIRLVGIQHRTVGQRSIKGVQLRHVVVGIADRFPELERAIAVLGLTVARRQQ